MELIKCEACRNEISPNANACPNCGDPIKHKGGTLIEKIGRHSSALTPILIALVGGAFTAFRWYDDRATRIEEKDKNQKWLAQQFEINQAKQRADRAVELLRYVASDKVYERKLSILLALAFASQNQLSDGVVPVLVQAGYEDEKFKEQLKYALLNLKDEAEEGDKSDPSKQKLHSRVVGELNKYYPGALAAVITESSETKKREGVQEILHSSNKSETSEALTAESEKTIKETLQVLENSSSKDSELIVEEVKKFVNETSTAKKSTASDSTIPDELFRISRTALTPETRDKIYRGGIRLVIAVNDREQMEKAHEVAETIAARFEGEPFRFAIENVREIGANIPANAEIRFRKISSGDGIPETVEIIQKLLPDDLAVELSGLPESVVAEGEFEIWFGDGQKF